jgi:nickel/cobalt transporter (NicO) family protein
MTIDSALALGFGLGLRHALDADHLVAIGTLLQRDPRAARAATLAALWGLGHSMTFLGVGLVVVLAEIRVPAGLDRVATLLVAVMLVALGARSLCRLRSSAAPPRPSWGPLLVGVVHGLAGSAAITLLALTTIPSRLQALAYLALFAAGSSLGMIGLTVALSRPLVWSVRRGDRAATIAMAAAAGLSVALGVCLGAEVIAEWGAS